MYQDGQLISELMLSHVQQFEDREKLIIIIALVLLSWSFLATLQGVLGCLA